MRQNVGSCNTRNEFKYSNKAKDVDLSVLDMITGINESKILTKDIACK